MTAMLKTVLFLGLAMVVAAQEVERRWPVGAECAKQSDCPPGSCCTIGYERYSYPSCRPLQMENDNCIPSGPMTNGSRYWPDGSSMVLGDVYLMMCPCGRRLRCYRGTCDPIIPNIPNTMSNEIWP
ncbi:astakine-like [Copidosoma floridanum]|uniref:astakine-like n=1 Tax=Copidosoma floridanum TaxID=29053 RepID=UPI000C6FAF6E|nr:astakine-like [Copidosoma floridanum]